MYSLQFIQKYFDKIAVFKYVPFCPSFQLDGNKNDTMNDFKTEEMPPQCLESNSDMMTENTIL